MPTESERPEKSPLQKARDILDIKMRVMKEVIEDLERLTDLDGPKTEWISNLFGPMAAQFNLPVVKAGLTPEDYLRAIVEIMAEVLAEFNQLKNSLSEYESWSGQDNRPVMGSLPKTELQHRMRRLIDDAKGARNMAEALRKLRIEPNMLNIAGYSTRVEAVLEGMRAAFVDEYNKDPYSAME